MLVALALPARAQAATPPGFAPCADERGFYCGTVIVPIDRGGTVPELIGRTIALSVMWKPAAVANTDGAMFALAGGPGQGALSAVAEFERALAPALQTRDLVVFDQRGTGKSGFLDCPGAQSADSLQQFVGMCASELGRARDYFTSKDSAEDIDFVRQAIGVERVTVFGVSYGTYVAQLYAKLFPTHAASLVLDSVVPATGVDPFLRSNFAAVSKVLAANCSRRLCRKITRDSFADLRRVAKRLAKMRLRYVDPLGRLNSFRASQAGLLDLIVEVFSLDAVARARLPAALRSALAGDTYPLGRLFPGTPSSTTSSDLSTALYMATSCSDTRFPWASADVTAVRENKAASALAEIPQSAFNPFPPNTSLALSNISLCLYWPASTVDASVTAPPPDIPVLVLDGLEDALTPLSDGAAVASLFPHSARVNVPFTGHSVISDVWPNADLCVKRALTRFFARQPLPSCSFVKPFFRPTPIDPTSLARVRPLRIGGLRGRTLAAVLGTISDVTMTSLSMTESSTGLRGGLFGGSLMSLRLLDVIYVPGVSVNGTLNIVTGTARVTVGGKGSHGKLLVRRGKRFTRVTGTLGGKRLRVRVRTSANDAKVLVQLPRLLGLSTSFTSVPLSLLRGETNLASSGR